MLNLAASFWLVCTLVLVWHLRREVAGTTLVAAWRWGFAAWCLWCVAWCCEFISHVSDGVRDQLWYAIALLLLAALITILGAKRPGSRVWTCFVTIPMLLTLSWPALYSWIQGWPPVPLRLMNPALGAFGVVCVMGLGNYVGTRFLWSACLLGLGLAWLVLPYAGWAPENVPSVTGCRMRATFCAGLAVIWPGLLAASSRATLAPWDRVWGDFVNMFGIAWGRRLQDRFNQTAHKSGWGVKLDFYGLTWENGPEFPAGQVLAAANRSPSPSRETPLELAAPRTEINPVWTPEMIAALQWLLRRFVDPVWIERRLALKSNAKS